MKKIPFIFLGAYMLLPILAKAQIPCKLNLRSPYDTVQSHLMLLKDEDTYNEEAGALFMDTGSSPIKRYEIAKELKQLLQRERVNFAKITKNPNYIDPKSNGHRYLLSPKLPQIYLVKQGEEWLYSKDTLNYVKQHDRSLKMRKICYYILPKTWCKKQVFLLAVWQYLLLIGIAIIIWLTHKLMPYLFHHVLHKLIGHRTKKHYMTERILFVFITLCYLKIILTILQLPDIEKLIDPVLKRVRPLIVICLAYRCVSIVQEYIKITKKHNKFMVYMLPLASMIAKIIIVLIGCMTVLTHFGYETSIASILQLLSFSTLGFSLAAKDTIQNIFGSFMIMVDRPFMIGDEITAGTIRGKVEEIGLRATLLRTKEGSVVYIPNGKLADSYIDNLGRKTLRMIVLEIPLSYEASLEALPKFVEGLLKIAKCQPLVNSDKTSVYIDNMKEYGLVISFNIYLDTMQSQTEQEFKNKVIPLIITLAHQLNLRLGKAPNLVQVANPTDLPMSSYVK